MKFEKPVAEIEKFDLRDVISSSTTETESYVGSIVWEEGQPCTGRKSDDMVPNCV